MAEVITCRQMHIEHRNERRADNEIENPLESDGNGHRSATDRIREDLGDKHPADGSPAEHEACTVEQERNHA